MSIYKQLNDTVNEEQLTTFLENIEDRFGKIPKQVFELCNGVRLKWMATKMGMEQLIIKNKHLRCYFIANQQSSFYSSAVFSKILSYVQQRHKGIYLRETEKFLVLNIESINSMKQANEVLAELYGFVFEENSTAKPS
jgi:transcription-repair coupling factor (superfamily II helicase)